MESKYLGVIVIDETNAQIASTADTLHIHEGETDIDPLKCKTTFWKNGSSKTPITILIQSDGKTIHSFGHDAERNYNDLLKNGNHTSYFYLRGITRIVDLQTNLDETVEVRDEQGKRLLAFDVIVILLEYLVNKLNDHFKSSEIPKNLQLVISLPSRSQNLIQFVEKALNKIGIDSSLQLIISSSTANANFFTYLQQHPSLSELIAPNTAIPPLTSKLNILTVYFEETFIEASIHEYEPSLAVQESKLLLREIIASDSSLCYGMLFDIFGKEIDEWKSCNPEDWSDFFTLFQIKKKTFKTSERSSSFYIKAPESLRIINYDQCDTDSCRYVADKLKIPSRIMENLFENNKSKVVSLIKNVAEEQKIKVIFLVGENSNVPLYQNAILCTCKDLKIQLVITSVSDTVLLGSMIAGINKLVDEGWRAKNVIAMAFDETSAQIVYSQKSEDTEKINYHTNVLVVPTSVSLLPDGKTLHLFGEKADVMYSKGSRTPNYFVRGIKQILDAEEKLDESMEIKDENGKPLVAFDVLVMMFTCLLKGLRQIRSMSWFEPQFHTRFVITLPSRSTPRCVDFFRKAASKAGITSKFKVINVKDAIVLYFLKEEMNKALPSKEKTTIASVYLQETFIETYVHEINGSSVQSSTLKEVSELCREDFRDHDYVDMEKKRTILVSSLRSAWKQTNFDVIFLVGICKNMLGFHTAISNAFAGSTVVVPSNTLSVVVRGTCIAGHLNKSVQRISYNSQALLVGSIDFGTTYSGWAASFRHEPSKCSVKLWSASTTLTEKTPTVALIKPDGYTLEAFGYEAEKKYQDLIENKEHVKYFYFRNFKMALHQRIGEGLNRNSKIKDETGKPLPIIIVLAASIRFLKEHLIETQNEKLFGFIQYHEIQWVLTVPAIWTDAAKQLMKEAAVKAGIRLSRIKLALEPEAASIFCRELPMEVNTNNIETSISSLSEGKKYMIVDAGGGTVDITVHEVVNNKCVREICAASGGRWGGNTVNDAFENYIERVVGKEIYNMFIKTYTDDRLELIRDFEMKKRIVSENGGKIYIHLCRSLIELFETSKTNLSKFIEKSSYSSDLSLVRDKLYLSNSLMKSFFKEAIDNTVCHIRRILSECPVSVILMVGGFSDSPMLKHAIVNAFPEISVVKPEQAVYSIVKGAAIFGHNPWKITERVLKYTYGIGTCDEFDDSKHPASKRYNTDAGVLCRDVFGKHVERNQRVKVGEAQVEQTYTPVFKSQKRISFDVYASESCNPRFTDDDCKLVGKLSVDLLNHDGNLDREVLVSLTFSGTEITIQAKDIKEGRSTSASIDFLG